MFGESCSHRLRAKAALAAGLCIAFLPSLANAAELPQAALEQGQPACGSNTAAAASPANPIMPAFAGVSKSSAILGGQMSALERMKLAQQESFAPIATSPLLAEGSADALADLVPAAGGEREALESCNPLAGMQVRTAVAGEFLASKRLRIGRTTFDRDWRRVSRERVNASRYATALGPSGDDILKTMGAVNRWVNRNIAFTEDRDLFARADYWAGANRTLRLGRGDCEDIALTKMQLLAASGIPRSDMILTLTRDLVRNADHAVLIVRHEGRYYLLDNTSDEVFDASLSHDYRPIVSFGSEETWLHGY